MNLKLKIWLILSLVVGVVLTIDAVLTYKKLSFEVAKETKIDAQTVYSFMMAVRRVYQEQFLESKLPINQKTVGFLPAHSMSRISSDFANWNTSGMTFNNKSDRPRNPSNMADKFELEDINWFRTNKIETSRIREVTLESGLQVTQYTAPIWIEPICLKCHSSKKVTPDGLVELYPDDPSFGYQVGDLRGIVSIRIPAERLHNRRMAIWKGATIQSIFGFILLLLVLGAVFEKLVIARLARLQQSAKVLALGDYSSRIERTGSDEICQLGDTFNYMASEIEKRNTDLLKLSLTVEQSPEIIFITNLETKIEYANASFLKATGYQLAEIVGKLPQILKSEITESAVFESLWGALKEGKVWKGEFINRRKDGSLFTCYSIISPIHDNNGKTTHYVAIQQDMTEKYQDEERIHRLAFFNEITNLPNRLNLSQKVQQQLSKSRRDKNINALVLLNIDRFKNINNARGHLVGDALLKKVAECLAGLKRSEDVLAHLSADEFSILITDLGQSVASANRQLFVITEKIHKALAGNFIVANETIGVSVSIGVKFFPMVKNETTVDVFQMADTALRKAKICGGNTTSFYEQEMGEKAKENFLIENELRVAVQKQQLALYLQPQVDRNGKFVSAEVLVRWQHPERGMIPPNIFIPIAEESDLIVDLSHWIFTEACALIVGQSKLGKSLSLSVNISPRHFAQNDFVDWVQENIKITGVDPTLITLEVTEGLMISDVNDTIKK
ncbi:MAG: diguanylate cyclase, partial [Gammaproteobacteria bacterium]|nr:diguanylate cyclase [Gammaproteobacteria bacterium]